MEFSEKIVQNECEYTTIISRSGVAKAQGTGGCQERHWEDRILVSALSSGIMIHQHTETPLFDGEDPSISDVVENDTLVSLDLREAEAIVRALQKAIEVYKRDTLVDPATY